MLKWFKRDRRTETEKETDEIYERLYRICLHTASHQVTDVTTLFLIQGETLSVNPVIIRDLEDRYRINKDLVLAWIMDPFLDDDLGRHVLRVSVSIAGHWFYILFTLPTDKKASDERLLVLDTSLKDIDNVKRILTTLEVVLGLQIGSGEFNDEIAKQHESKRELLNAKAALEVNLLALIQRVESLRKENPNIVSFKEVTGDYSAYHLDKRVGYNWGTGMPFPSGSIEDQKAKGRQIKSVSYYDVGMGRTMLGFMRADSDTLLKVTEESISEVERFLVSFAKTVKTLETKYGKYRNETKERYELRDGVIYVNQWKKE